MDVGMLGAAWDALAIIMDPFRLGMLATGTLLGLFLGIIPGIGGLVGMALLLPFTFTMEPYAAFAMLLGMTSVTNTSDTIPAVLFAVPGSASAQATVMDGNPMARKGEAGRALASAYTASLLGGLFGALVLAMSIPVMRPLVLMVGAPEFLALSLFGLAMVSILSGNAPMRGVIVAGLGVLLSMVGAEPQTGAMRWTMGSLYLWEGLPLVPIVLGLFALPELADLAINRQAIASKASYDTRAGMLTGIRDSLRHWWLIVRCSSIGAGIGALPGVSPTVVDWLAYGHALQSEKGARNTFGKGDVRGVIAPESANNATTAGSLVPTIALGVPGSAATAILLSVFLVHGMVPGPAMLTTNLTFTYSLVWSVAIANVLGAGLCLLFSGQLAKIALLRYTLVLPAVLIFVFLGSFQSSASWGDFYVLMGFAVLGWIMKQLKWPRPPIILGLVLGELIERYMFISFTRYGWEWMLRPLALILLVLTVLMVIGPVRRHLRSHGGLKGIAANLRAPMFRAPDLMHVFMLALVGWMMVEALNWRWAARVGPMSIGLFVLVIGVLSLLNQVFSRAMVVAREAREAETEVKEARALHMDTVADYGEMPRRMVLQRAAVFFGFLLLMMGGIATIGFLPAIPLFIILFMRLEGRERWSLTLAQAVFIPLFVYVVFHRLLRLPWPQTLLGDWFPALGGLIPSV